MHAPTSRLEPKLAGGLKMGSTGNRIGSSGSIALPSGRGGRSQRMAYCGRCSFKRAGCGRSIQPISALWSAPRRGSACQPRASPYYRREARSPGGWRDADQDSPPVTARLDHPATEKCQAPASAASTQPCRLESRSTPQLLTHPPPTDQPRYASALPRAHPSDPSPSRSRSQHPAYPA
jgi:hypothetical protein